MIHYLNLRDMAANFLLVNTYNSYGVRKVAAKTLILNEKAKEYGRTPGMRVRLIANRFNGEPGDLEEMSGHYAAVAEEAKIFASSLYNTINTFSINIECLDLPTTDSR